MKTGIKILGVLFCFALGFLISSCNRSTINTGKVSVQLPVYLQTEAGILSSGAPPNSASEIDCFGFLISNSDAGSDRASCKLNSGSTAAYSRSLTFKKAIAGFYSGDTAEFEVDAGSNRVIHVVGLKTNLPSGASTTKEACHQMLVNDYPAFSKPFLIGSSSPFSVTSGSTQVVSITNGYIPNSTEFFDDCEGPGAPGAGGEEQSGPPVKAKIKLQDNLTNIYSNACVAAALELYDANDRLAKADQILNFTITATGSGSEVITTGDFCDVVGGTSSNITFSTNEYGRKVFYVKYVSTGTYTLTMTSTATSITSLEFPSSVGVTIYTDAGLPGNAPLRYSIFDVHSFKTTFSSRPANPIEVKAGECRPALIQIVDNQGRPIKAYNNGSAPSEIATDLETVFPVLSLPLFLHVGDCSTALGGFDNMAPGNGNPSGFSRFKYKVPETASYNMFKLKVSNMGGGYIDASGDINPLDPNSAIPDFTNSFWSVED